MFPVVPVELISGDQKSKQSATSRSAFPVVPVELISGDADDIAKINERIKTFPVVPVELISGDTPWNKDEASATQRFQSSPSS